MENILTGLKNIQVYLDDIIISGKSVDDCKNKVWLVLGRLQEYRVKINFDKCQFFRSSVIFLGHKIDKHGVHPTDDKMDTILNAPQPKDTSQLKSFLGLINYYRGYIPMSSTILSSLYNLTKKNVKWVWSDECESAFKKASILKESQLLVTYNPDLPLILTCDSSSYGVGAVLSHIIDKEEKPIMFASSTLSAAEKNYSQIDREALAIIFGIKKFHKYLFGRKFILVSDHLPLKSLFNQNKNIPVHASSRLQRWAIILSGYDYEFQYRKGSNINNADALSRLPIEGNIDEELGSIMLVEQLPLTFHEIANGTSEDAVLKLVCEQVKSGWVNCKTDKNELEPYFRRRQELSIEKECLIIGNRVVVPNILRQQVLNILHKNHPGIVRSKMLARSYVWWPNIDNCIEKYIKCCSQCQFNQNDKCKNDKIFVPWPKSEKPWQRIHIDFLDVNKIKLLILVDSGSKWIECWALNNTTATMVIRVLSRCFCTFGSPEILVCDNGPPFGSKELKTYCNNNSIKLLHSPPYNPESNGLAERGVQTIKKLLIKSLCNEREITRIQTKIDDVLLSYRNTPSADTGCCPAEIMLNFNPKTQLTVLKPKIGGDIDLEYAIGKSAKFEVDENVLVKNSQAKGQNWLPGKIMKVLSGCRYLVTVNGGVKMVHVNKLKCSMLSEEIHQGE
uniref:RNA-directed DNA polymerase n=1 Tax=Schizaphis graminum TaxID=13262 RepID=A0A2S2ND60_SCHGA